MANGRRYRTEFIIDGDSRSAVKANNDAAESTERLTKEMQQAARQSEATSQGLMDIGSRATTMAAAVGLSATGIATMTAQTAAAVRDQVTLANAVGVNVQTLQSWGYAARQVGLDSEKMGDIFKDTADKIGDFVRTGGGEAADLLEQLNLDIAKLQGMRPDQQLLAIGQALDDVQSHGEKVFFMESIADDASKLLPLLEHNAQALREYQQQARDLRIELPQEDIDRLDEAGQSMQYLQEAGRGLAQTVAADLAPTINGMAENVDWLIDSLGGMEGVVDKGTVALELMASVAAGKALVGIGNLRDRVGDYIVAQQNQIKTQNTAIETERRASAEALRLAQSRQASAKQMLANAQATAAATGITTNRTRAIAQLAAANAELISAEQRHAASLNAVTAAATRSAVAMQVVQRVGSSALAMLGGWPGLLIAGASALVMFSDDAEDTAGSIDVLKQSTDEFTDSLESMTAVTANAALVRLGEQIDDIRDQMRDAAEDVSYLDGMLSGKGPVSVRGAERVRMENDLALARERLQDVTESYNEQLERQEQLQQVANGTYKDAAEAADDAAGGITRVGDALGTSADKWDDYLGKLESARDTLGMTAEEAAEYAANQAGYTGLYAEQSGAIAGQTDALKGYQSAIEQGDQVAADAHLATAQRFAEQETMVQAQLANLGTLSGLLQGVQSDLSATALSAALVVGDGASNTTELVEQALATIEARAAAIRGTIEFGSKATDETKALNKELADAEKTYDNLRESFDPLGTAADEYAKKQSALNLLQQHGKKTAEEIAQAQFELTQQYRESIDPLQGVFDRMDPAAARLRAYHEEVANLEAAGLAAGRSQLEIYAATARVAAEFVKAEQAADPYAVSVENVVEKYNEAYTEGQRLQRELKAIREAWARDPANADQYARAVAGIRDEMRELALESDPAAQEMARAWEEAADRIDETFADAFAGAFDGFDDFSDQLLDGFKRLLAELAYQATLKPIVVQFTGQMQSALGIPGASGNAGSGGGGFGGMSLPSMDTLGSAWNTAQNAYAGWTGTYGASLGVQGGVSSTAIGSANAVANGTGITGASNAAFGSGTTTSSLASSFGTALAYYAAFEGGGYLGNSVGEGLTGKHANSNYGQMAGTAIGSYFGGVPGAFIGSTLGGMVDSMFGSSREPKVKGWQGALGSNGDNEYRDYHADSAFGTFTILDKVKTEPEDILNMLDTFTTVDNGLASVMTDSQLTAVTDDFAKGWKINEKSVGGGFEERYERLDDVLVDSAKEAYTKALLERAPEIEGDDIDEDVAALGNALQLNKLIDGLSGNIKDYAIGVAEDTSETIEESLADVQSSIAANSLLSTAADRLNLQFDALADGAIEAGNRIAELAGGVDALSSTYESYYQAVFSDTEKLGDSYQSLGQQFDDLGVEMPNTVDALRDLVESQALNTDESRKLQLQLMQLAPTFAETTSSVRDALTQQYQDILDRAPDTEGLNYWIDEIQSGATSLEHALESIANSAEATTAELKEIMQSASDDYESAMSQARDYLAGITNSLSEYLDQLHSTDAGLASPGDQLAAASGAFSEQYQLALSGDRDALGSITQYASRLIDAQTQWSGSGTQTQDVIADITSQLEKLPERLSPEQFLADEIRDAITDGISDLTDGIATTIAGSFDAIDFNQDDVIDWSEFRRQFEGLVDNDTLRDIFGALDNNGNGVIDQLESDARAIEAWSSQQPESAQSAIQEMLDMYEEILGRQADLPGIDYYLDQYFDGMSLEEIRARLEDSPEAGSGGSSSGGGSGSTGGSYKPGGSDAEGDPLLSDATGDLADAFRDVLGRDPDDSGYAYYQDQLNSGSMTLDEIRDRLADSPEANGYALGGAFVGGVQAFAKGGMFANSVVDDPTYFNMGLMGEAGPEAIMPLSRGADGSLGVRAELPPLVIPPAALGGNTSQIERLLQENNRLMQENTALLKRLDAHGAAGVRVAQAGHRRQIEATERGNRSLEDLAAGSRLEHAR